MTRPRGQDATASAMAPRADDPACREGELIVRTGTAKSPSLTVWSYQVVAGLGPDGSTAVRITGCSTQDNELRIPSDIEGLPVVDVAAGACAGLGSVIRIVCPATICHIGSEAFARCVHLVAIDLPAAMQCFDARWLLGCSALASLGMPGQMRCLQAGVLDGFPITRLRLGPGTVEVDPEAFVTMQLMGIEVDARNPVLSTDGHALFADGGLTLTALATPLESYEVPRGCQRIAPKAFFNRQKLQMVVLPDTLQEIGRLAFAQSGLRSLVAPASLRRIDDRAFFRCAALHYASLNPGIEWIGRQAFAATGLAMLHIPSDTVRCGQDFAPGAQVSFGDSGTTVGVRADCDIEVDVHGGLYRNLPDGKHLVRFMDHTASCYEVTPGTRFIDSRAFMRHGSISRVVLPEGLERIGDSAFSGCHELRRVDIPVTLTSLGDDAFYDTMIDYLELPAGLVHIGDGALVTRGAINGGIAPSLKHLGISADNPRYRLEGPLLLERCQGLGALQDPGDGRGEAGDRVLLFLDTQPAVWVPDSVVAIGPHAFSGARNLKRLRITDRIASIERTAFDTECIIEHLRVDLTHPVGGHATFELDFPPTARSRHEITMALGRTGCVDIGQILRHYDEAVFYMIDYAADQADITERRYRQAKAMLERLADPVLLSPLNRNLIDRTLRGSLADICMAMARHDDRRGFDLLADLGYLDERNILQIIDLVTRLEDAAMTSHLLEMRRQRFGTKGIDLSL